MSTKTAPTNQRISEKYGPLPRKVRRVDLTVLPPSCHTIGPGGKVQLLRPGTNFAPCPQCALPLPHQQSDPANVLSQWCRCGEATGQLKLIA